MNPCLLLKIWLFHTTPWVFPCFMCSEPILASMIYWFLLILGCQACTKSLITYVANIDSSYVGFLIILRSYVCRILDLYQVLTYVCRIYLFLISTIFCQYWIPTYVGYDNLFQTGILCSKKAVHLLQREYRHIPQASLVSTIPSYHTPLLGYDFCM